MSNASKPAQGCALASAEPQQMEQQRVPQTRPDSLRPAHRLGSEAPDFDRTEVWVFDLDNTLYPADTRLFVQVDQRMGEFIARYLGVPFEYARHLQKSYYRQFGTTLTGLMKV